MKRRTARRRRYTVWLMAVFLAALLLSPSLFIAGRASAAGAPPKSPPSTSIGMNLDCGKMAKDAQDYAKKKYGLCDAGTVQPQDRVSGNCGWSDIFISQGSSSGYASIQESAFSYLGPIISANYGVYAVNWTTGAGTGLGGTQSPWSFYWSHYDNLYTGVGTVNATLNGSATLVWGGVCTFAYPSSTAYIP